MGSVRILVGGFSELQTVLYESTLPASTSDTDGVRAGVVLVQFSAHWCGPCKRIRPLVEQLAAVHTDIVFVYVDAEQTEENQELTHQLGVRGFPTFLLYEAGNKKEEWSGADSARLTEVVRAHSTKDASSSPAAAAPARSSSGIEGRVQSALVALKAETSFEDFVDGASAIQTFVANLLRSSDPKYRRVKVNGAAFMRRLGRFAAGHTLMQSVGFEKEGEGDDQMYVMKAIDPGLSAVAAFLGQAIASVRMSTSRGAGVRAGASAGAGVEAAGGHEQVSNALESAIIASARLSRDDPALVQQLAPVCAMMLIKALMSQPE